MKRREFIAGLSAGAFQSTIGLAKAANSRPLVAVLLSSASARPSLDSFVQGMRQLGYVEGRDYDIVSRHAEGDLTRMPALAAELVRLEPNVFVTGVAYATLNVKKLSGQIPIVNPTISDPGAFGGLNAIQNGQRRQVTGMDWIIDKIPAKQLDLLRNLLPTISKVGFLVLENPSADYKLWLRSAAEKLGINLIWGEYRTLEDIKAAFEKFSLQGVEAVLIGPATQLLIFRKEIAEFAIAARLPTMCTFRENVEAGGLMSYATNVLDNWGHAAAFVVKILKGAKPEELPAEFPTKFDLVINLKTANAIGIAVPQILRLQADEIIE